MTSPDCENDIPKAQSIIHKLVRLGSKVGKPLSRRNARKAVDDTESSEAASSVSLGSIPLLITTTDDENDSIDAEIFQTLDQNECLVECFVTNEHSDISCIVHFFQEDSAISKKIEDQVTTLVRESSSECQCLRVDARLAPLFTAKLGVDPGQPAIVAIRNGTVIDAASNFSSKLVRYEVERWVLETGILCRVYDSFANLSSGVS